MEMKRKERCGRSVCGVTDSGKSLAGKNNAKRGVTYKGAYQGEGSEVLKRR